jgi:hypothetical protein
MASRVEESCKRFDAGCNKQCETAKRSKRGCDPFETSSRLAFLGSFVNIGRMTVIVITFANLWWRST